jgi:CRP/FNR family cyclic AMP-dependent transcriptional regulator
MKTLEEQLETAGLKALGCCQGLSAYGPDFLQTSQLLQDFTPAEADILGASMLLVHAAPGQVMIREGEFGDWMMLILKGTVDVTKRLEAAGAARADAETDSGAEAEPAVSRVAVVRAGAAVGDMSMLDSEPRYATCTAIEAVEAGVWGRREIALLIRDHPGVGAKLLVKITQMMAQRLRNTSNQLVKLLRKK